MDYSKATDGQLKTIAGFDKELPTDLAGGIALEMINRGLWIGLIKKAGDIAYGNLTSVMTNILHMEFEDLIQCGHIEIMKSVKKYKPGKLVLKTYLFMCLRSMFHRMLQDENLQKRKANIKVSNVEKLPETVFRSYVNVERFVINKVLFEQACECLREVEKQAVTLWIQGNAMDDIGESLGYAKSYGKVLITRAFKKMRKVTVA